MSICYHGKGSLVIKQKYAKEFCDKFLEIAKPYDANMGFMLNDKGLMQFLNYARHHFIDEFINLIECNVSKIQEGQIWFTCYDEDSLDEDTGFPFIRFIEVKNGRIWFQALKRRLPPEWEHYCTDDEWFTTERERIANETRASFKKWKEENDNNQKEEPNDLPF